MGLLVICHQFERKKIAPMSNFATKEKLGPQTPPKFFLKNKNTVATRFMYLIFQ